MSSLPVELLFGQLEHAFLAARIAIVFAFLALWFVRHFAHFVVFAPRLGICQVLVGECFDVASLFEFGLYDSRRTWGLGLLNRVSQEGNKYRENEEKEEGKGVRQKIAMQFVVRCDVHGGGVRS